MGVNLSIFMGAVGIVANQETAFDYEDIRNGLI